MHVAQIPVFGSAVRTSKDLVCTLQHSRPTHTHTHVNIIYYSTMVGNFLLIRHT